MKRIPVLLAFALPLVAFGQQTSGRIIYQESMKFEIRLPEGQEEMAKNLPSSQSWDMALHFNDNASLYENYEPDGPGGTVDWVGTDNGATINVVIKRPEHQLYKDLAHNKKVEMREFLGKRFLIKDDLEAFQWKLTGEQQMVLDYPCFKAVHQDSNRTVVAWFTPQIPVSSGPGSYGQLPGMILAMNINDGERTITATAVVLGETDAIEPPSKGKEVTQAEFDIIEAEKRKEMEAEGGEGGMIIKIRN